MSLGSQVEKYRKQVAGLSFPQLAELSGVDTGTINALEKRDSNRVDIRTVMAIAGALGLTIDELANEDEDHSDKVIAHTARRYSVEAEQVSPQVAMDVISPWGGGYWPFRSISPDRFRSALDQEDIERIETYARAIIDTREAERLKNVG